MGKESETGGGKIKGIDDGSTQGCLPCTATVGGPEGAAIHRLTLKKRKKKPQNSTLSQQACHKRMRSNEPVQLTPHARKTRQNIHSCVGTPQRERGIANERGGGERATQPHPCTGKTDARRRHDDLQNSVLSSPHISPSPRVMNGRWFTFQGERMRP